MANRLTVLKTILWAFVGVLAAVTVVRFALGLGAVTNLSDATPWGLWIAFDVMAGVALAAGGFVIAAAVYIFRLEEYRSFARPAILTALLGYLAVAIGLLYDLGLPWHIWHPMIHWQYTSVLFEVAMCVMLYLTVLTLEFAPVILEHPLFAHPWFQAILKGLKRATIPLVIAGIVLSTLHQSSLGSLFLITPYRLHPLWYSPIIYVLYFVSAVGLGLTTVVLESLFSAYFLNHKLHTKLLSGLGLAAAWVLTLYAALRLGDLAVRGLLGTAFDGSPLSVLFWFELAVSAIIPAGLLFWPKVRSHLVGVGICAGLAVFGIVLNRIDACLVAFARPEGVSYFPTWAEFAVSAGIVSGGVLIFIFFAEYFKVFGDEEIGLAVAKPSYDPATLHNLLPDSLAAPRRYSLVAVSAAAIAMLFLPVRRTEPTSTPVLASRTVRGLSTPRSDGLGRTLAIASPGTTPSVDTSSLLVSIDGNRNGTLVLFDHARHVQRTGGQMACAVCHHLNMPLDQNSSCSECHRDMYEPTAIFDHQSHVQKLEGNAGCQQCHQDYAQVKSAETATACAECHQEPTPPARVVEEMAPRWGKAVGYVDAMHGLCIECHQRQAEDAPGIFPASLGQCAGCHNTDRVKELDLMVPRLAADAVVSSGIAHGNSGLALPGSELRRIGDIGAKSLARACPAVANAE